MGQPAAVSPKSRESHRCLHIADTACATESMQELLIGLKRRELGKHPSKLVGPRGPSIATLARAGDRQ